MTSKPIFAISVGMLQIGLMALAVMATTDEALEHQRLYTPPDSSAAGGITGRIVSPAGSVRQVVAIPAAHPERAYRAEYTDESRRTFRFRGLPMDRYDLVVIFENVAYEGLRLTRGENSLTSVDLQQIKETIERSEPFFTVKILHRVEGETGRGNQARAFCTFARDLEAEMYAIIERFGYRRTHKLVVLQQVGPGWQLVRARDLYPIWVEFDQKPLLRPVHHYRPILSGIRVTDQVRDLGELSL